MASLPLLAIQQGFGYRILVIRVLTRTTRLIFTAGSRTDFTLLRITDLLLAMIKSPLFQGLIEWRKVADRARISTYNTATNRRFRVCHLYERHTHLLIVADTISGCKLRILINFFPRYCGFQ